MLLCLQLLYNFEKVQEFKVQVVDIDKGQDAAKIDITKCVSEMTFASFIISLAYL